MQCHWSPLHSPEPPLHLKREHPACVPAPPPPSARTHRRPAGVAVPLLPIPIPWPSSNHLFFPVDYEGKHLLSVIWHLCRAWWHGEATCHTRWVLGQQIPGVEGLTTLAPLESSLKTLDVLLPLIGAPEQAPTLCSALLPGTFPG